MQLSVEDTALGEQLRHQRQDDVEMVVDEALDTALRKEPPADRWIAFHLPPRLVLAVEYFRRWQFAQVVVRTEKAQRFAARVAHDLDCGQHWPFSIAADVRLRKLEIRAANEPLEIRALRTVSSQVSRIWPLARDVVDELVA
jgi:hypothetical protein